MFGDDICAKFMEKWPTVYKSKVLQQSRGLTQTAELQDLVQNAESTEAENGMLESTIIKEVGLVFDGEEEGLWLVKINFKIFTFFRMDSEISAILVLFIYIYI